VKKRKVALSVKKKNKLAFLADDYRRKKNKKANGFVVFFEHLKCFEN